jgi:hypothetical protein
LSADDLENYIVEYTDAVYSTRTADWETVLRGHMFSWVSILMYYYGWGHYLAKYMKKQGVREIDFFEELLMWIEQHPNTLLHSEYQETRQHIYNTFHNKQFWGRKVRGDTDIYWEYKGASSIVLHDNKDNLQKELTQFLIDTYNLQDADEIVQLNLAMTRDKNQKYPAKFKTKQHIAQDMLGINSSINTPDEKWTIITIDHHDKQNVDDMWYNKAYHWDRKSRYWRCTAKSVDK